MTDIAFNENMVRRIIRAIDKAIADDIPQYLRDHHKETNNAIPQLRGDNINENLRNLVVNDDVQLIPFKRYCWNGRLLVDYKNKITYSIMTQNTLRSISKKKSRTQPHYLQSILFKENGGYEGQYIQETLIPMETFDDETFENDYNEIISGMLNPSEGYRHYIISYATLNNQLIDVKLEFLDQNFLTIAEKSLNSYIKPDFARLTDSIVDDTNIQTNTTGNVRDILGIKPGLRSALKGIEEHKEKA